MIQEQPGRFCLEWAINYSNGLLILLYILPAEACGSTENIHLHALLLLFFLLLKNWLAFQALGTCLLMGETLHIDSCCLGYYCMAQHGLDSTAA